MWINFTNLNGGSVDDFLKGNEPRETCSILCEVNAIMLRVTEFGKQKGQLLIAVSAAGADPKFHFTDEEKAKECYAYLAALIPGKPDDFVVEVDALAQGAL